MVLAELLALSGAFIGSLGTILVRRGLEESNFLSASMIITLVGTIVFCIVSLLLVPLNSMNTLGILFFVLAGLFSSAFSRLTYTRGMEILGASTNASISSVFPLFSSILAVYILGERPSLGIWLGMICVICGVVLIERNVHITSSKEVSPTRIALVFPLSSALLAGFGLILRKMGLNVYDEPIAGVAIAHLSSLCFFTLLSALSPTVRRSMAVNRKSLKLFWRPGLIFCVSHLCYYYALRYGNVSLVTPLTNIQPFFVFIFAYMLIRKLEKITYMLIIGTILIVTGVSLITIF